MAEPHFRKPLTPTMAVTGVILSFGLAAMVAWASFLRSEGPRLEQEVQLLGCSPFSLKGDDGVWLIRIDKLPYEVRLERSEELDAALQRLCLRGTRARLVTRESNASFGDAIAWVQGLEGLDNGQVIVSEEDYLADRRLNNLMGLGVFVLFLGMGVLGAVLGLRDFREQAERRKAHREPPRGPLRPRAPVPARQPTAPPALMVAAEPVASPAPAPSVPRERRPPRLEPLTFELSPTRVPYRVGALLLFACAGVLVPIIGVLFSKGWKSDFLFVLAGMALLALVDWLWTTRPIGSRATLQLREKSVRVRTADGVVGSPGTELEFAL